MASQQQPKIPTEWDVDVIDYWNASLSSYKKHHENADIEVDSNTVTSEFLDSLPVKQKQAIAETEPVIPQATNDNKSSSVKRKKMVSQESKVTQESQIGAWSYVNNNQVEEEESKEKEEESKEYGDYDQQKDEEEEDYYYYQGEEEEEVHAKRARYNQVPPQPQPQAQVPPPPPPGLPQNNEALSNLIMAWYYAGYYTGLYQAGR